VLQGWAARTHKAMVFTFAPSNPMLLGMKAVGRLFPRANRAPWIEPVAESTLRRKLALQPGLQGWQAGRTQRVSSGFYTSQAFELRQR